MLKWFFWLTILGSFACFFFGVLNIFSEVEDNACRMTYMFQKPQFMRIPIKNAEHYDYELYFYHESGMHRDFGAFNFRGAPVIFVPGNGGSYKQVRSLASVALRKAISSENNVQMDFFTINFNEELTGLYGGYLARQTDFLRICIRRVLELYKMSSQAKKVALIGHSMGGKVAEAVSIDADVSSLVNTIIFISTPLESPVLNIDGDMNHFYESNKKILKLKRTSLKSTNTTNTCCYYERFTTRRQETVVSDLQNVLFVSIGGGSRDLLVRSGLTTSQFVDVHAMATAIPKVWLSCDHLAAVWCLQLVLVINRFLFKIVTLKNSEVFFIEDKTTRLQTAVNFFVKPRSKFRSSTSQFIKTKNENENLWNEDSRRIFNRNFNKGVRHTYNQMLKLSNYEGYRKVFVEITNVEEFNWLYGCTAKELPSGKSFCEKGHSLANYIQEMPSKDALRSFAVVDLNNIKNTYKNWTHLVVRIFPSSKMVNLNVDVYDPAERSLQIKMPTWYNYRKFVVKNETHQGMLYLKLRISDLHNTFQSLQLNVDPQSCIGAVYSSTIKICSPWAFGFDKYHVLTEKDTANIFINVPTPSPIGYNTSRDPVLVELYLDPTCRYNISYKYSVVNSLSRIVQETATWIPAHLIAVLCIVLKNQIIKLSLPLKPFTTNTKPFFDFFQYSSLFTVTGCRLLSKLFQHWGYISNHRTQNNLIISIIVHGTAIIISIIVSLALWSILVLQCSFLSGSHRRLRQLLLSVSESLVSVTNALPITFGVLAVSIAIGTSCGISLALACTVYYILLSNTYCEYIIDGTLKEAVNTVKGKFIFRETLSDSDTRDELDKNISNFTNTEKSSTDIKTIRESRERKGLNSYSFHIALLLMLVIMTVLNAPTTFAWIKSYKKGHIAEEPSLLPVLVALTCLSILWQLGAPNKIFSCKLMAVALHICAIFCLIICQQAIYQLNTLIAIVYVLIVAIELIGLIQKYMTS